MSSGSAISPNAVSPTPAPEKLQQLVFNSKNNFLKATLPALTTKLSKMVTTPSEEVHQPTNNSRPPLSDKEFRSFLDNVGELGKNRNHYRY